MRSGNLANYIPERGDIVWLVFNPQAGHEHSGRRPAIVISPKEYNKKVGLAIFCPITSKIKDYPFEVKIKIKDLVQGAILADQVKSIDWKIRKAQFIVKAKEKIIIEVINKISLLIGYDK